MRTFHGSQFVNWLMRVTPASTGNHDMWSYESAVGDSTKHPAGDTVFARTFASSFARLGAALTSYDNASVHNPEQNISSTFQSWELDLAAVHPGTFSPDAHRYTSHAIACSHPARDQHHGAAGSDRAHQPQRPLQHDRIRPPLSHWRPPCLPFLVLISQRLRAW